MTRTKAKDMQKRLQTESKLKTEAIEKLEGLRNELALIEGGDFRKQAEVWKDKCRQLVEVCRRFKLDNEALQHQINSLNSNFDLLQKANILTTPSKIENPYEPLKDPKASDLESFDTRTTAAPRGKSLQSHATRLKNARNTQEHPSKSQLRPD